MKYIDFKKTYHNVKEIKKNFLENEIVIEINL